MASIGLLETFRRVMYGDALCETRASPLESTRRRAVTNRGRRYTGGSVTNGGLLFYDVLRGWTLKRGHV